MTTSFSEQLAEAKAAPRPHKDVPVIINTAAAEKRAALEEQLERAKDAADRDQRLSKSDDKVDAIQKQIDELLGDESITTTLRFYRLPGRSWSALTVMYPRRQGVQIDNTIGYNIDLVCEAAAQFIDEKKRPYGFRLEDGEEVALVVQRKSPKIENPLNEWSDLYSVLSGYEIVQIRDVIWELNDYGPRQELDELVKSFGAATRS